MSKTNYIVRTFATTYDQPNEIIQNYNNLQRNGFALIVDKFKEETKDLDEMTMPYVPQGFTDKLARLIKDPSDSYFQHLYIKQTIDGERI